MGFVKKELRITRIQQCNPGYYSIPSIYYRVKKAKPQGLNVAPVLRSKFFIFAK
jgi:hypothetical protein